ncbi:MAG: patatin-like phospholipase family protein [Myxococcota bacterium]
MRSALLLLLVACSTSSPRSEWATPRDTCLVLSVGGPKGVAHIGAIQAVKDAGIEVDCVFGNSMGSLVGAIYAAEPEGDVNARFLALLAAYEEETRTVAGERAGVGGLLGLLTAPFTGGASLVAAGVGAVAGAATTRRLDHARMIEVLDRELSAAAIETLPLRYATSHLAATEAGIELTISTEGNLAAAVGASVANPLIFSELDVRETHQIDPGVDRVSATPIEDACAQFSGARMLAINVAGAPAFTSAAMNCPVREVQVELGAVDAASILAEPGGEEYLRVVREGYIATCEALSVRDCAAKAAAHF